MVNREMHAEHVARNIFACFRIRQRDMKRERFGAYVVSNGHDGFAFKELCCDNREREFHPQCVTCRPSPFVCSCSLTLR